MSKLFYKKCDYDQSLIDGDYQTSFFFSLIDELKKAIENKLYLTSAITLLCCIEQAGREVLRFLKPNNSYNNTDTFNYFLENYMDYGPLLKSYPKLYDTFRNGLTHEGNIKHGGELVTIGAGYSKHFLKIFNLKKGELRGLYATAEQAALINDILLCEFLEGIIKFRKEEIKNNWHY